MFIISNQNTFAQNGFTWSSWVGCITGENDRKNYTELIESGLCHRACQQSTITYTITGATTSQITNTVWHVVGGTILSTPNNSQCIVKWGSTATGAIGFTTTQVGSNTTVTIPDLCVNLTINPQAMYTIAPVDNTVRPPLTYNACTGQELFFENFSTANGGTDISSYYWDFGDGTTSSVENPSHTFNQDGTYFVTLKVDNQCNCSSTITYTIEVKKKGVQIECASIVCEGQKATYTIPDDFSQNCTQFNWSVIGGTILTPLPYNKNIQVLWDEHPETEGFGYVTFDPIGCNVDCYRASTLKIPIIKQSAKIEGESSVCGPTQVRYKLPQWPTTDFQWEIENSGDTNASLTPTDQRNEILLNTGDFSGTLKLKCNYTNTLLNCGGIAIPLTIVIKQPADITGASITCVGMTETYIEASGLSVNWQLKKLPSGTFTNFTGIEFSPTFTIPGDYSLTASGLGICNPISKLIQVTQNATPLATDFTSPLTVCPGSPVTYTFNNTAPNTKIGWQVIGGQVVGSYYGNSVQIQFGLPPSSGPNYTIKLWRENISGPPCESGMLTLTPSIPIPLIDIKGNNLALPNINPCGSSSEIYQVEATDMDNYEWEILPANAGNITIPNINEPWKITVLWNQFTNQSATLRLKTKKCLLEYIRTVAVTISSPTVTINPPISPICRNVPQTFTLSSNLTSFSGTILWDFGNGVTTTTTVPSVNYTYTTVSTTNVNYLVKATITNPNDCVSVVTTTPVTVQINVAPVAVITPSNLIGANNLTTLLTLPVANRTLTATISAGYGATTAITWYKNNTLIVPQPTPNTSYIITDFGNYYAEVANVNGCTTKTNTVQVVQVNPDTTPACPNTFNPILSVSNNCGSIAATVTNVGNPTSVQWNSSNGSPSQTPAPTNSSATFNFTTAGQYTIVYEATYNNNGVPCKVIKNATIIVPYIADLKYAISCGTGANYTVKLLNNSNFYPATPIDSYVYKVTNLTTNVTTTHTATQVTNGIALPAGNYKARIEIKRNAAPAYPMCFKELLFTLEPKPSITFTKSSSITCPGEPITLTPSVVNPNWTYLWTFAIDATNTQPSPFVTYSGAGQKSVFLKVTNQYGCSFTTPAQLINVKLASELTKEKIPTIIKCQGTPASFSFTPTPGDAVPVYYKWMKGNAPAPGNNTTNPYTTSVPGSYWLQTANSSGCFKRVKEFSVSVAFVAIPFPIINSTPTVCVNNGVLLSNYNNGDPTFQYIWRRDGALMSIEPSFTDYPSIGSYTYTLEVRAPLGDGTYCSKISDPYTVTVIESPVLTNIEIQHTFNPITGTCNPFKVELSTSANAIGTFTWSNGMTGATINETAGGAYQVLFTSPSGCTATKDIYVPKDLSSYMWVVPKGCYTFCEKLPTQQVIGPAIQEFPSWAWLQNAVASPAGTLEVTPKDLNQSGNYQLQLADDSCLYKSDSFSVNYQDCDNNTNCNWFSASVNSVNLQTFPYIHYILSISLTNTSSTSYIATITTQNEIGFFIPATITVPPGGGIYTVSVIANNSFTGGNSDILVTVPDSNGNLCQKILGATLPGFGGPSRISNLKNKDANLLVYPNPASNLVTIQYEYSLNSNDTLLQLYDTTARLISSYKPTTTKGSWEPSIDNLASGMYIIVMKQDGVVIAQQNLIKR